MHFNCLVGIFLRALSVLILFGVGACSTFQYQPIATIDHVDEDGGYRLKQALLKNNPKNQDDVIGIVMFSGGGTRAAAFGYGVLETLNNQQVKIDGKQTNLLDTIDVVYGISGGSVLAAYFGLHGSEAIPSFEKNFLSLNLQKKMIGQVFSIANWSRLTSPQFGRGDLLQEQFDLHLYHGATYADLNHRRKGPFTIISATDMSLGSRLDFTQEYFDLLCLDLNQMPISRVVAASSAVPLVFSPVTLNNNGGNCGYHFPSNMFDNDNDAKDKTEFRRKTRAVYLANLKQYQDSQKRPYIHLLDGGLTDNLGLRSLLDTAELYSNKALYDQLESARIKKIIIINVNAQAQRRNMIDNSATVPGTSEVARALSSIPIEKYSEDTQRQFQKYVDWWNENRSGDAPRVYYISINLLDLPPSPLRDKVVYLPTTFYLTKSEVNNLRKAANQLLVHSTEYQRLIKDIGIKKPTSIKSDVKSPESYDIEAVEGNDDDQGLERRMVEMQQSRESIETGATSVINFINTESVPLRQ